MTACEHLKDKRGCKKCAGSRICEHGKQKPFCEKCGGSQICKHQKRRDHCGECGGSQICPHDRHKRDCSLCKPNVVFKAYKQKAAIRGFSFRLTPEQFVSIISQPCLYCDEA